MIHDAQEQSVTCDGCDYEESFPTGTDAYIEAYMIECGWYVNDGEHLCCDCKPDSDA